ncbi:M20 metallopeptidase family protein [Guggenheimella bovis]
MKPNDIKAYFSVLQGHRRALHKIPELQNDLPKTSQYIQEELDKLYIPYRTYMDGNGIVAVLDSGKEGKTLAFRADMDALPILEETGLPFASDNGCMHACGHDAHMATVLTLGAYLKNEGMPFKGKVALLFQPGEEMPGGAEPMIQEGALDGVDAILGMHAGRMSKELKKGNFGFRKGPIMASMDYFKITITGHGVHGAYPDEGIDPIPVSAELVLALQTIMSRGKKTTEPGILSVCHIEGGYNQNIIPDKVILEGTVRAVNETTRLWIKERIETISEHIALAHGAKATVQYELKYPVLVNDASFTERMMDLAKNVFSEDRVVELEHPVMGGEDFSFYTKKIPGTFFFLNNLRTTDGIDYGHHTSHFDLEEEYLLDALTFFVEATKNYLNEE